MLLHRGSERPISSSHEERNVVGGAGGSGQVPVALSLARPNRCDALRGAIRGGQVEDLVAIEVARCQGNRMGSRREPHRGLEGPILPSEQNLHVAGPVSGGRQVQDAIAVKIAGY